MQTPLQPVKRGAVYHVRFHVPADLWRQVGPLRYGAAFALETFALLTSGRVLRSTLRGHTSTMSALGAASWTAHNSTRSPAGISRPVSIRQRMRLRWNGRTQGATCGAMNWRINADG